MGFLFVMILAWGLNISLMPQNIANYINFALFGIMAWVVFYNFIIFLKRAYSIHNCNHNFKEYQSFPLHSKNRLGETRTVGTTHYSACTLCQAETIMINRKEKPKITLNENSIKVACNYCGKNDSLEPFVVGVKSGEIVAYEINPKTKFRVQGSKHIISCDNCSGYGYAHI